MPVESLFEFNLTNESPRGKPPRSPAQTLLCEKGVSSFVVRVKIAASGGELDPQRLNPVKGLDMEMEE